MGELEMDRCRGVHSVRYQFFLTVSLALLLTISATLVGTAPKAVADSTTFWGRSGPDGVGVDGATKRPGTDGGKQPSGGPKRQVLVVPACAGNEPSSGLRDTLCPLATSLCAGTPDPDDVMFWIYTGPVGVSRPTPQQWVRAGQRCMSPTQAGTLPGLPPFTLRDFRRLPLPPGGVNVQPPNLRTLVNVPTNLYVEAETTVLDTTLLGFPVQVRATPQKYHWQFGDGAAMTTDDKGAPYPDLRTTHTYTRPGHADLTLVTAYTGEYSIAGGPWLPIDGTAQVTSPPVTLTVLDAHNQLISGNP
jgi:hypothetical protein